MSPKNVNRPPTNTNLSPEPLRAKNAISNMPPGHVESRPPGEDLYALWAEQGADEDRGLRFSIGAAVLVHALLLLITFPQIYTEELEEPPRREVIKLAPTPRFQPPPIEPIKKPPKPRARRVPIPDPTPDSIEPILKEETIEIEMEDLDNLDLAIPPRPPEPEPTAPLVVGGEVKAPQRLNYVAPQYPELARRARLGGKVILRTVIDREGNVTDFEVIKSLSFGLTEAAIAAVKQWKFSPGTLRGKPVAVIYQLEVNFQLR